MSLLFAPGALGTLSLPNRLVRSATAEQLAEPDGQPKPRLKQFYAELARGGVGLIVTGHMYIHAAGKAHPEMTGIYADELIPPLAELAATVHGAGGRVAVQINYKPARPLVDLTEREIAELIPNYAQAARRVQQAGFDAVQLHGAHGYLISQFLSPFANRRTDAWGGSLAGRTRFLREVCQSVREQVGRSFPMFVKLGLMDAVAGGLTPEQGVEIVAGLEEMGLDALEISGGLGGDTDLNTRKGIRAGVNEAYFRPLAHDARRVTRLPIILVGGFRTRAVMEEVLAAGDADFISMSRPLICEPDLPTRLRLGLAEQSLCKSASRCWPEKPEDEGIACKCHSVARKRAKLAREEEKARRRAQ